MNVRIMLVIRVDELSVLVPLFYSVCFQLILLHEQMCFYLVSLDSYLSVMDNVAFTRGPALA